MIELFLSDSRAMVQDIIAWTICIAALLWGGGPERAVAMVWLVLFEFVSSGYELLGGNSLVFRGVHPFFALIDFAALACWVGIALNANRNYTLWIAAMQVLAMTAHLARGLVEAISPIAYVTMVAVPGWVQLLLLALGLGKHLLRKRKFGDYRDWRVSRPTLSGLAGAKDLPNDLGLQQTPEPTWRDNLR